ncbi:hypothetical protein [Helicobacter sp.]|uniref:hypothetical protein n=1 Tax=Helicobacter sp. TaxID=218 RepID=UPI0025848A69|nr:hypothetical protein [Helicobacter sp.]MCI7765415.1 hypothetical protein [Helicobacter sp.]
MENIRFKMTFLDSIVLSKTSNTEGNIEPLDFVSGSCFLGIVAKEYDSFENPFMIFHSGDVRFGDAHLLHKGKKTYKIPLCFFAPKNDHTRKEIYNHHFVNYADDKTMLQKQLKQLRTGFITQDLEYIHLDYYYAQKSAYDTEKQKSKDSSMFGYTAMQEGSEWEFSVSFSDVVENTEKDKIIQALCGEKFIGKSKTAQYGKVLIEKLDSQINTLQEEESPNEVAYLYLDSHLVLFNGAVPTWIPTKENLGLMQGEILWEKTQIKTRKFSPFNFKRQCRETERLIIEKGSVIAVSNLSKDDREILKNGVGAFLSEGYGKILINPSFLLKEGSFSLKTEQVCYHKLEKSSESCDENLICYLEAKKEMEEKNLTLGEQVEKFIEQHKNSFKKVSNSQWGEIRMRLQFYPNNYKDEILEYIKRDDTIKPQWKDGEKVFANALKQESIEFLKLLANMMPKAREEGDNE